MPECCTDEWSPVCAEFCRLGGHCETGPATDEDWVTELVAEVERRAQSDQGATWEQAVATLKGRIVGEPWIVDEAERSATEELLGVPLDSRIDGGPDDEEALRRVCGALLVSPQFMLDGVPRPPPPDAVPAPIVVPGTRYSDHCETMSSLYPDQTLDCSTGTAVLR